MAVALILAAFMGSATPAAAQEARGIIVGLDDPFAYPYLTLSVFNLTGYPLSLVTNSVEASGAQRPPFWGNTLYGENAFPLKPYRNVTWKSNTHTIAYPDPHWKGTLTFLPQGMDPKWTVTLNFQQLTSQFTSWIYVTADFNGNPDWQDAAPYNVSCSYPGWYNSYYNVMTLSGKDLVVSLYVPYLDINQGVTQENSIHVSLVFRQRWPHTPFPNGRYQDSLVAPCLTYQCNSFSW
ncbi:MAG: hypothetical protein LLG20_15790 [Acidobacteriales bacterium]|nr:hypothetical protein [Terriglobales bacterium]